jgi:hypothetical protein
MELTGHSLPAHTIPAVMSPTIFREAGYRFYFFSREERRVHVHVHCADGEEKFWLEPIVQLAQSSGLTSRQLGTIRLLVEVHAHEIRAAWERHFGS